MIYYQICFKYRVLRLLGFMQKTKTRENDLKFISKLKDKVIGEIKENIFENKNQQTTYSDLYDIFLRYNDEHVNKFFIFHFLKQVLICLFMIIF